MAFVRIKKIKNGEYAYKVANEWTEKGSRQKVKGYIGKVVKQEGNHTVSLSLTNKEFKEAINSLLKQTLLNIGFNEKDNRVEKEEISVHLENYEFLNLGKKIAIALNEGFMCKETMEELMGFQASEREDETGIKLANALLEAGLKLDDKTFVELFEKVMPKKEEKIERVEIRY